MTTISYVLIYSMLVLIAVLVILSSYKLTRKIDVVHATPSQKQIDQLCVKIIKLFASLRTDYTKIRPSDIDLLRMSSTAYLTTSELFLKHWKEWVVSSAYVEWLNYWYRRNIC